MTRPPDESAAGKGGTKEVYGVAANMKEKLKNSALVRMFRSGPKEEEPPVQPEAREEPAPEVRDGPPPPSRHELQLPEGHALKLLWQDYREQLGWAPRPVLYLEEPGAEILPEDEAEKELRRLQMKINVTANQRLDAVYPRKSGKKSGAPGGQEGQGEQKTPPCLDAQVMAAVSGDGLTAWLLVYPPVGAGRKLDRAMLTEALEEQKVCFGVDEALLDRLPQETERYFRLFTAARGTPPVHGADGRVVDLFPRTTERTLAVDEHNRVDYASVDFISNIEKGGEICRIIAPTRGVPGQTVDGREIRARDGRAATVPRGRNTQLSGDGGLLLATMAGHVEFNASCFHVKPLMEIPGDVDYSVGNINFLGDVLIHGDIRSGFTVRAMGSITVDGVVEACTVEAGGDVVVARGVQGDDRAVIRAQRNLFAKYLENSCIYVKETLHTDSLINCDVYCDGSVEVRSGRMTILGGMVRAAHEVSAGVIGSQTESQTNILLGGLPCGSFDYEQVTQETRELEAEMEALERRPDSPDKLSRMSRIRMQLIGNRGRLKKLEKERERLESDPKGPGVRRMACDVVYPGTVLTIGEASHRFERRLTPCNAALADGEIRLI